MTYYSIDVIAFNTYLGMSETPTFKFILEEHTFNWWRLEGDCKSIFVIENSNFWECYDALYKFLVDRKIDLKKIDYPEIYKYIKYAC